MANSISFKEAICENLTNILSSDKVIREKAEQQSNMLETNEEYGLFLMEISLSENLEFPIRQLSSVLLNQYITKHWCSSAEKFIPPEVNPAIKQLIREYLLKSLSISSSEDNAAYGTKKLLKSYAHALSKIAQFDWPQNWPQLFPVLIGYLRSGSPNAIYSTLKVFKELAFEIADTQIPDVAPLLLPEMLNILTCDQFSIRTRTSAINVFTIISETIMHMNEYQSSIKLYLSEHIPKFAESVISILMLPDGSPNVDIGLKKEIINALNKFLRYCKKHMKVYLPKILELIWHSLTTSASVYVRVHVNSNSCEDYDCYNDECDSDGDSISFESFIYAVLDFVTSLAEIPNYRSLIKPVLSDLLYFVLFYMQIPDEQAQTWLTNLDLFIEQDDIDTHSFSIRLAAQDLVMNLAREMTTIDENCLKKDDELFKIALLQAINRHFSEASELEKQQKLTPGQAQTWWKMIESCLLTIGLLAPTIIFTINSSQPFANQYQAILDNVLSNFNISEPFLAGRSLWIASRFSKIMNDQSLDNFLKLTSNLLNNLEVPILRVYALRATYYFCENIQINQKVAVIKPHLSQFLQGLISFGMNCNSDTLFLVLQTITLLLGLDKQFTASVSSSVCTLVLSSFINYSDDPSLFFTELDILEKLFQLEQCPTEVYERLLPIVNDILTADGNTPINAGQANSQNAATLKPQALEILSKLLLYCNQSLPDVLIQKLFPSVISCIQKASIEDSAILQNGSECLRMFILKGSDQLNSYVDADTLQNGISLCLGVCNYLLNPKVSDSSSAYIGRLIITLIMKANHVIGHDNIELLLRSTLVRINFCNELPVTQGLILVFAHLLYTDLPTILMFLSSLPAPGGTKSALEFVLDKWLGIQRYFHGYENKASTIALCQLFKHSFQYQPDANNSGDSINLHRIEVSCDDEFTGDDCVRTRSKTQAAQKEKRRVPCTVKILKLLINELLHIREMNEKDCADGASTSEDDDDDENDTNDLINKELSQNENLEFVDLNDLLAESEEDLDDDEILNEEIGNIDLESVLKSILMEFQHLPIASQFLSHLTHNESLLLKSLFPA